MNDYISASLFASRRWKFLTLRGRKRRISSSLYPTCRRFSSMIIGLLNRPGFSMINVYNSFIGNDSISTFNFWKVFERVEIISSVPSSVILRMALTSSKVNGSENIFLSVYGISFSCNHALAFRQDVQLGEVNNVTI